MARVFTIYFDFNANTYTAMVSQTNKSTTIFLPDESLHSLLPQGKFSFDPRQGIPTGTADLNPAQGLVSTILGIIKAKSNGASAFL